MTTAYGAGLRVGEVARLKVASIDSARMLIRIERGKGGKERYVMLSAQLLQFCAPTGGWHGRGFSCSLAERPTNRSASPPCSMRVVVAHGWRNWASPVHTLRHNSGTRIIPATDVQRMYFLENRGVVGTRLAE